MKKNRKKDKTITILSTSSQSISYHHLSCSLGPRLAKACPSYDGVKGGYTLKELPVYHRALIERQTSIHTHLEPRLLLNYMSTSKEINQINNIKKVSVIT